MENVIKFVGLTKESKNGNTFAMVRIEEPNSLTVGGTVVMGKGGLNDAGREFFAGKKEHDVIDNLIVTPLNEYCIYEETGEQGMQKAKLQAIV